MNTENRSSLARSRDARWDLLLDGLTQLSVPDDDWYYGINVVASLPAWATGVCFPPGP